MDSWCLGYRLSPRADDLGCLYDDVQASSVAHGAGRRRLDRAGQLAVAAQSRVDHRRAAVLLRRVLVLRRLVGRSAARAVHEVNVETLYLDVVLGQTIAEGREVVQEDVSGSGSFSLD